MSLLRRDFRELLRLSRPAVASRLGGMAMGLTDTVVVGRHSATELGYMALGWAANAVILVTAIGLMNGVPVLTAMRAGEGRKEEVGAVFWRGLIYGAQVSLALSLGLWLLGPPGFAHAGLPADLARGASGVVRVLALSLPLSILSNACSFHLEGMGRPARSAAVVWAANLVNLVGDLVLVDGLWGAPAMGAEGAAWATFIGRCFMLAALFALVLTQKDAREHGLYRRPPRDPEAEARQRKIGYAAGAALLVETAAFSGMNLVAGWVGGLAVAGWAIVLNVAALVFMVPMGVSAAASVLVARAYGAQDWEGVRRAGLLVFGFTVVLTGVLSVLVLAFAPLIARGYAVDPPLIEAAAAALMLASAFFVADGLQVVGAQMLRAAGDAWMATWAQVVSYAVLMLPLGWAFALPLGGGLSGIVVAALIASLVSASLLVGRFLWLVRLQKPAPRPIVQLKAGDTP